MENENIGLMFQSTSGLERVDLADVEKIKKDVTGQLYKKEIVTKGKYADQWFPELSFEIDDTVMKEFTTNFKNKIAGRIAVPAMHTTDPEQNRGELLAIELEGKSLMGYIDIRDEDMVKKIDEGVVWDVSISFTHDYVDNKGKEHGHTITHVALVNNPYIKEMKPFQALSEMVNDSREALAKMFAQPKQKSIMLSESRIKGDPEMIKLLNDRKFAVLVEYSDTKGTHSLSVEAGKEIEIPEDQKDAVQKQFDDAEEAPAETAEEKEAREKKEADEVEAARIAKEKEDADADESDADDENLSAEERLKRSLSREGKMKSEKVKTDAEAQFATLLKEGKVVPAQKESFIAFATTPQSVNLSDKDAKSPLQLLSDMFSTAKPVVEFGEKGTSSKKTEENGSVAYSDLSEADKVGLKATGVTEERYEAQRKKHPHLFSKENKKEEK